MEILMVIIVMVLGAYLITQFQTYTSEESSKTRNSGIFSSISEGNNDNAKQEPPRFQMDQNLFTIDGLDRFFDSIIEFLRTGEAWEWVKNWLQKSKIELPVFYIGIAILFLIFAELIFILGIITVITYFSVKKIKAYRDKNLGFASSSSPVYTSQYSTYSANDFGTTSSVQPDYPEMMKGLVVPVLKQVGKYLGYLFLFLVIIAYVIYKFFLPSDIQKKIETEVLTYGFSFRLGVWNIDPPWDGSCSSGNCGKPELYSFRSDVEKRCAGYIHKEVCEGVLADVIDNSSYGFSRLYEYCTESENVKKGYCISVIEQEKIKSTLLWEHPREKDTHPSRDSFDSTAQELLYTIPAPNNGGTHAIVKNGRKMIISGGVVIGEEKYPDIIAAYLPAYSFDGKTFAYIFEKDGRKFIMQNDQRSLIQRTEDRYDSIEDLVLSPIGDHYALLVKMLDGKYIVNAGGWESEEYDSIALFKNPDTQEGIGFEFLGEKGGIKYLIIAGLGSMKYNPGEHGNAEINVPTWMGSSTFTGALYK